VRPTSARLQSCARRGTTDGHRVAYLLLGPLCGHWAEGPVSPSKYVRIASAVSLRVLRREVMYRSNTLHVPSRAVRCNLPAGRQLGARAGAWRRRSALPCSPALLRRRRALRRRRNLMVLPWVPPIRVQLTPPAEALLTFAASCAAVPFSAHPPGRIDSPPPLWYVNDHEEAIGQGRAEFVRAGDALRRLDCLQLDWLRATVQGDVLAICSRQFGVLWLMNANRLLPKAASDASGTDCVAMCWGTSTRHVRVPTRPLTRPPALRPTVALSLAGAGGRGAALRALGPRQRHRALPRALVLTPPPRLWAARLPGRAAAAAALRKGRSASHAAGLHRGVRPCRVDLTSFRPHVLGYRCLPLVVKSRQHGAKGPAATCAATCRRPRSLAC